MVYYIADKIKLLREAHKMTQTELAQRMGITRSGVNAWEMGISVPSTQYIAELAQLFSVSADYLLGISEAASVKVDGLTEREIAIITELIECMRQNQPTNRE